MYVIPSEDADYPVLTDFMTILRLKFACLHDDFGFYWNLISYRSMGLPERFTFHLYRSSLCVLALMNCKTYKHAQSSAATLAGTDDRITSLAKCLAFCW